MRIIRSINELIVTLDEIFADDYGKIGGEYTRWYRGQPDIRWALQPSVQRVREYTAKFESRISNDFIMNASVTMPNMPDNHEFSKWITIMQHYGLPTRLLDWSESPLVALHFAVAPGQDDADASFYVLNPGLLNRHELGHGYIYSLEQYTISDLIYPAFRKNQRNEERADKIAACKPLVNDRRVYAQHSAFTVHNSTRLLESIGTPILEKLCIPADAKPSLRRELRLCSISERFLFPDLSHITKDLRDRYDV
ncbi:MAG: FRG domain-containing protein [Oscillospiraceae bacterium]|nr:FRG domain-containing protein [Oscillospiraceae bacterium]